MTCMTSDERLAELADAYRSGMLIEEIKYIYHTSSAMIRRAKDAYGLPDRPKGYLPGTPRKKLRKGYTRLRTGEPRCRHCRILLSESVDWKYPLAPTGDLCRECESEGSIV